MVIFKTDVEGISFIPYKRDPPLLIYPYRVTSRVKSLQRVKLIGWGEVHIFEPYGRIQ